MVNFFLEVDFANTSDEFTSIKDGKVKLTQILWDINKIFSNTQTSNCIKITVKMLMLKFL